MLRRVATGVARAPRCFRNQVSGHTESEIMANLGQKDGVFHVRFRFHAKEYKKSLKTRDAGAAAAAVHLIELTIHRLHTGQARVPDGVDPGDFIVSGGTLLQPIQPPSKPMIRPSTRV